MYEFRIVLRPDLNIKYPDTNIEYLDSRTDIRIGESYVSIIFEFRGDIGPSLGAIVITLVFQQNKNNVNSY